MLFLSITGFYPDHVQNDTLQFELDIDGSEMNDKVAQLIESKPLSELDPGELVLSEDQVAALGALLGLRHSANIQKQIHFTKTDSPLSWRANRNPARNAHEFLQEASRFIETS